MKVILFNLTIVLCLALFSCNEKAKSENLTDEKQVVKEQAKKMGDFLLKKELKPFIKFTYPTIVEKMGGEERMIMIMEQGNKEMEAQGTIFSSVIFGEPSDIITTEEGELQCTLSQTIEMKVKKGRLVSKSTLIAISIDQGKNWFFIDTSGKDIQTMKKALPNLSNQLKIEQSHQPVFYEK